jgi:HPt (histidine-containing phosphotransfer) domain-containing protein
VAGELGTSNYEEQVRATRAKFIARSEQTLDGILSAIAAGSAPDSRESQARKVHRLLHDMAGNAAMLDLHALDQKLRQGVEIAEVADAQNRPITPEESAAIRGVVDDARLIAQGLSERV